MVSRDVAAYVRKMIDKLRSRLRGLITRASILESATTDQGQVVSANMLQGEMRPGAEYFEPYGIAGAVPTGSTGVALAVGGSRDHVIIVCASPKGSTPEGRAAGEVDLYATFGQRIRLHADGSISLLQADGGAVYLGSDVNPAAPAAARDGDPVTISAAWATWAATVGSFVGAAPPGAAPIGTVGSTTTTTRIG